jgi:hypothetical protein
VLLKCCESAAALMFDGRSPAVIAIMALLNLVACMLALLNLVACMLALLNLVACMLAATACCSRIPAVA